MVVVYVDFVFGVEVVYDDDDEVVVVVFGGGIEVVVGGVGVVCFEVVDVGDFVEEFVVVFYFKWFGMIRFECVFVDGGIFEDFGFCDDFVVE